jgi:hypothetical protein
MTHVRPRHVAVLFQMSA